MRWHVIQRLVLHKTLFRPALLSVALLDELVSGLPVIALPLVRDDLGLSYAQVGLIFTVSELAQLLIDPALNLFSDGRSKRWLIIGGMLGLALGFGLAAQANSITMLLLAFALIGPAGSAAVGLAQAVLIDLAPDAAPRTMTRWTIVSALGDLLAPTVTVIATALQLGWRALFWLATALWLGAASVMLPQRFPPPLAVADEGDQTAGVLASLRVAWRTPMLLRWLSIVLLTPMLDEVFLGFAALLLQAKLGANTTAISVALGAQMLGALLGLVILDRVQVRFRVAHLLICAALITFVGVVGFLLTDAIWLATVALFILGLGVSSWYPLAKGAAYATMPGRSGVVRAIDSLGAPFEIALPFIVGLVAERFGIIAGVATLGTAPLLVLALVPWRSGGQEMKG